MVAAAGGPDGLLQNLRIKPPAIAELTRFAQEIEAGMTAFHQIFMSMPETSFGGIKHSGHGRELGSLGLYEFMNAMTLLHSAPHN